jgi:hypothetical protein
MNDAGRDSPEKSERVPHRDYELARPQQVRLACLRRRHAGSWRLQ